MPDPTRSDARSLSMPPPHLVLLPSPFATVVSAVGDRGDTTTVLYGPHSTVWSVERPVQLIDVPPDLVKLIFGTVSAFVDRRFGLDELPLLQPFTEVADWSSLICDARNSITVTDDHRQFLDWFAVSDRIDRQVERLCRRYAGQTPRRITQQRNVSAEFVAQLGKRAYVPTGCFADQSHYIRTCRNLTAFTPTELRNLSDSFYAQNELVRSVRLPGTEEKHANGARTEGDG
jgi:hypothetical protein